MVQDNVEAPYGINITESQSSGLADVTEPTGKVGEKKKKRNSSSQDWIHSHRATHCKCSVLRIFGGSHWSAHASADPQAISLTQGSCSNTTCSESASQDRSGASVPHSRNSGSRTTLHVSRRPTYLMLQCHFTTHPKLLLPTRIHC